MTHLAAHLRASLDDAAEAIHANVENGPWACIPDPALRRFVRGYVADACHNIALAAGLDTAADAAHNACPTRLPTSLPATPKE